MDTAETVAVRIAVAVDQNGDWHAVGCKNWSDDEAIDSAVSEVSDGLRTVVFLNLDIPKPVAVELKEVSSAEVASPEAIANIERQHTERMRAFLDRINRR